MDEDAEAVEQYVRDGRLEPLNQGTFEEAVYGLREDLLNWDHGHKCRPILPDRRTKSKQ